ncbi:MAG: bifunctional DNA-binding transcriptional regulator/O6-methylguanine-DNA methyltransferase Ada [Thermomicrobiales bacterium]
MAINELDLLPIPRDENPLFSADDERWQAVLDRDTRADGAFFTCVHTTGIYCRPTCPARKPKRENVTFVASRAEALRSGFRPCKRCKPDDLASNAQRQAELIATACAEIEQSDDRLTLDHLAERAGMSRFHFHRVFKQITGVTPKGYADAHRADRVRDQLSQTSTITEAIYGSGFGSNGRFYSASENILGMTPSDYRAGGLGTTIRFAIGECSLGLILVASTAKGVCSILMGDNPELLISTLQGRFPNAEIIDGDEEFAQSVATVVNFIEEPSRGLHLPLDIRGTAFQQRVWAALREVPAGATASYSEIAARIGSPKAVRAVANACARNEIAVAIPCHRIVGKDGSLTGYRWGTERKQTLLEREREAITD